MSTTHQDDSWQARAACSGTTVKLFHGPNTAAAQRICAGCQVRAECLYDALDSDAPNGVWGGFTRKERRALPVLPTDRAAAIAALRPLLADLPRPEPEPEEAPPVNEPPSADAVTSKRPGHRYPPEQRADNERRTIALLQGGATYAEVKTEVGISEPTIYAIRTKAGIPASGRTGGVPARSKAEALAECTEPYGDGHVRWTGPMAGRMPQLCAESVKVNARHVVFEMHHGRPPVGRIRSNCGQTACISGPHLTDHTLRAGDDATPSADPEQPCRPSDTEDTTMTDSEPTANAVTLPAQTTAAELPAETLLAWADKHDDADIQDQAARAGALLASLRIRHAADHELAAIGSEVAELEERLAALRAREAELAPTPTKKPRQPPTYPAAVVRARAKENGIACPANGRVPKTVVDAWREATGGGS
ncbi:WhiB family transcriptional regulator [Streptomyces sp. NPDC048385]|uniref:WhiB family transcriptional regulator n=1 Tax=Streptomyces sp. NPDC048385 TaxID=3155145 RepID=UPI00342F705A